VTPVPAVTILNRSAGGQEPERTQRIPTRRTSAGLPADTRVAKDNRNANHPELTVCVPAVFRDALPPKAACDAFDS